MEKKEHKLGKAFIFLRSKVSMDRFLIILVIGLQIALSVSYLFFLYRDKLIASEGIRDTLTYQGKIANIQGVPPPDGLYDMRFKIYDQPSGGNLLWTETWNGTNQGSSGSKVNVVQGVFTVELNSLCGSWTGSCASNGGVTFTTDSFYLQVELDYNGDGTYEEVFLPRKRFTATPYAMNAERLNGHDSSEFLLKAGDTMTGNLETANLYADKNIYVNYGGNGDWNVEYNGNDLPAASTPSWTKNGTQSESVDSGILDINDSSASDSVYYTRAESNISPTTAVTVEAQLKVVSASGDSSPSISIFNGAKIGIIQFKTDKVEFLYDPSKYFNIDMTQYHLVRLVQLNDNLKVYVDGGASAVIDATLTNDTSAKEIHFGEEGASGEGESQWDFVRYSYNGDVGKLYFAGQEGNETAYLRWDSTNSVLEINKSLKTLGDLVTSGNLNLSVNPSDNAYLKWNSNTERLEFGAEAYIPDSMPYINNGGNNQDYTHFTNSHKILAYDFSTSSGTTATDLAGHADGTLNGNSGWTNSGYIGYGMKFGKNGDSVSFTNPGLSSDSGTVEMWVKLNDIIATDTNYLVFMGESGSNSIAIYKQNAADLMVNLGNVSALDTEWNFPDTKWHHIALTWNSGTLDVYADGALVKTTTYSTLNTSAFDKFYLGSNSTTPSTSLNGTLDSVAIYDTYLSTSEIQAHFNSAFSDLYVLNNISNGSSSISFADMLSLPSSLNDNNRQDPVNFSASKSFALAFSEGSGATTISPAGSNSGDIEGASWVRGYYGTALNFDGTDDYVKFNDSSNLNVGTGSFSIEFWIKGDGSYDPTDRRIISKRDGDTGYEVYFRSGGEIEFFIGDGTNTVTAQSGGWDMSDGTWHHVMLAFDRNVGNAIIYENAWPVVTTSISSISGSLDNSANLYIGKDASGNFFKGTLDSIILYKDTVLNAFDGFSRVGNGFESLLIDSRNSTTVNFGVLNQASSGDAALLAILDGTNQSGFPLGIINSAFTNNGSADIYNLITFGKMSGLTTTTFGNLLWDNTNNRFIFDRGINQAGSSYTNIFEGNVGIGSTTSPADALDVTGNINATGNITGQLRLTGTAPSTSADSCTAGDFRYDNGHLYICVDTNSWQRVETSGW
jgi:hypothetical protein